MLAETQGFLRDFFQSNLSHYALLKFLRPLSYGGIVPDEDAKSILLLKKANEIPLETKGCLRDSFQNNLN